MSPSAFFFRKGFPYKLPAIGFLLFTLIFPATRPAETAQTSALASSGSVDRRPRRYPGAVARKEDRRKLNTREAGPPGDNTVHFQAAERQTWIKRYAGQDRVFDSERGHFLPAEDGGFFLIGNLYGYSPQKGGFYILKLSANGHVEWQRAWSGAAILAVSIVNRTIDGGFILGGEVKGSAGQDLSAVRLSADGDLLWARVFDHPGYDDRFGGLRQTSDGGYLLTGTTIGGPLGDDEGLLIKLDADGQPVWQKTGRERQFVRVGFGNSVETPDGGAIVRAAASAGIYGERSRIAFLKFTSAGDVEWQRAYSGDSTRDSPRNLFPTADGGFILSGNVERDINGRANGLIMKLTPGCDVEWQTVYPYGQNTSADVFHQSADGGFVVLGRTWVDYVGWHLLFLRLTPAGEVEEQQLFGAKSTNQVFGGGTFFQETPGGGSFFGSGNTLLKVSATGEIERMPRLVGPGSIAFSAATPEPLPASLVTEATALTSWPVQYSIWDAPIGERLVFDTPIDLSVQTFLNRSLAQGEYYNELSWGLNPNNDDLVIASYEISYGPDAGSGILALVDGDQMNYRHLNRWRGQPLTYRLTAVSSDGGRSLMAEIHARPVAGRRP